MLDKVHDHIVNELGQSARTDTIFVIAAVLFNLIVLAVNSAVSSEAVESDAATSSDIVLGVFIVMSLLINGIAVAALNLGKRTRTLLLNGLVAMYHDQDTARYYNPSLVSNYGTRYLLFVGVIVTLALTSIIVPLVIHFL